MTTVPHQTAPPSQGQTFSLNQGGDGNSFSFGPQGAQPGAHVTGTIVDVRNVQETNFDTKQAEFWPDGNPKMQIRVTLQTDLNEGQGDDGRRDVYLNGYAKPHPTNGTSSRLYAVMLAVREVTGGSDLAFGAKLTIQWVSGMGFQGDPRHYQAWYELPTVNLQGPPPPATAPPVAQPPAQQYTPPTAPPAAPPAQAAPPQGPASNGFVPAQQGPPPGFVPQQAAPAQQPPAAPPVHQAGYAQQGASPVAGVAGAPLTQEQIQAVTNMGIDPAAAFGPDWAQRVVG